MSFFHLKNPIERNKYLAAKNLKELNLHELAYIHLNTQSPSIKLQDCSVNSRLYGLHEILLVTSPSKDKDFIMLITVISLINELCSIYTLRASRSTNAFVNFLLNFTSLTPIQAKLLYTLTKCLQTDGGLANRHVAKDMTLAVFKYSNSGNEAITPATLEWDGHYPINSDDVYTLINVLELQKMGINILDRIFHGLLKRKIQVVDLPVEDFFYKYLDKL